MRALSSTTCALLLVTLAPCISSFYILGLFPLPMPSHYHIFDAIMVALAERGHRVTVYDTFPKSSPPPNYKQVDLQKCFTLLDTMTLEQMISLGTKRVPTWTLLTGILPSEKEILGCRPLLDLRNSTESYDLIIAETFHNDFFALFGYALNIPVIVVSSASVLPWASVHAGLPQNPSYLPHAHLRNTLSLNFWDRIENLFLYLHSLYYYRVVSANVYDNVAAKFFGPGMPSIEEVIRNASMLFLNEHHTLSVSRPIVPNVIEIGGIHVKPAKPLPKDIEKFLNESTRGVVYFCMGSLLRGASFPVEKRDVFLSTFAKLPQRVLWKWEGDTLPGKSDNIMTAKWMPQRDILAHPNVKLFISHGGLLGTSEAVYEGVPVLGIPVFGDHRTNLRSILENGAGKILEYDEITETIVFEKVWGLLNNPDYKKKAVELSNRYKDRPMSPLDTAVYWTEYVIRHKGAHHLKTAAVHMPWYQYLLLDVIAFLAFVVISAFSIVYLILRTIYL